MIDNPEVTRDGIIKSNSLLFLLITRRAEVATWKACGLQTETQVAFPGAISRSRGTSICNVEPRVLVPDGCRPLRTDSAGGLVPKIVNQVKYFVKKKKKNSFPVNASFKVSQGQGFPQGHFFCLK